jgi:hypothetical protein
MTVPMGDYSQKKFIAGKYVTDENSEPITYISPVDTVFNISGNFTEGLVGSIAANAPQIEKEIWSTTLEERVVALQDNNLYNTLTLSCNFKTDLSYYQIVEGNYGLYLDFVTRPTLKSDLRVVNRLTLDSSEMFGNPYLFAIDSPQAKIIKLDTFGLIEGMSLKLYQKNNFKEASGRMVPHYEQDNIFVNNIAIGMGCDLSLVEDNQLELYTDNSLMYKYNAHTNETNLKTMGIMWFNKDS